jgi:hypothetical protein
VLSSCQSVPCRLVSRLLLADASTCETQKGLQGAALSAPHYSSASISPSAFSLAQCRPFLMLTVAFMLFLSLLSFCICPSASLYCVLLLLFLHRRPHSKCLVIDLWPAVGLFCWLSFVFIVVAIALFLVAVSLSRSLCVSLPLSLSPSLCRIALQLS